MLTPFSLNRSSKFSRNLENLRVQEDRRSVRRELPVFSLCEEDCPSSMLRTKDFDLTRGDQKAPKKPLALSNSVLKLKLKKFKNGDSES
mmetsp:Transcript_26029/g.30038  ORF Transcript_26029/g.30038 Transcript_26029/m.30038 type:complete len:89 (-) Transcript_26029:626-892(-)